MPPSPANGSSSPARLLELEGFELLLLPAMGVLTGVVLTGGRCNWLNPPGDVASPGLCCC